MAEAMIGPWRLTDWKSFVDLQDGYGSNALAWGLGRMPSEPQFPDLESAWAARRKHPVYQWLVANQSFLAAYKLFLRERARSESPRIKSPFAEFVFLRLIAMYAGFAFYKDAPTHTDGATARRRAAAVRNINELIKHFDAGIRHSDFFKHQQLVTLITELRRALLATKRKPYEGRRARERDALQGLASALLTAFDLASPAILTHFADMTEISCEYRTAQRYCARARAERRAALARALMSEPDKIQPVFGGLLS